MVMVVGSLHLYEAYEMPMLMMSTTEKPIEIRLKKRASSEKHKERIE